MKFFGKGTTTRYERFESKIILILVECLYISNNHFKSHVHCFDKC